MVENDDTCKSLRDKSAANSKDSEVGSKSSRVDEVLAGKDRGKKTFKVRN